MLKKDDIEFLIVHCSDTPDSQDVNAEFMHKMHLKMHSMHKCILCAPMHRMHTRNSYAYLLGITINNSWKINKNGLFPLSLGTKVKLKVHKPINFIREISESKIFNKDSSVIALTPSQKITIIY